MEQIKEGVPASTEGGDVQGKEATGSVQDRFFQTCLSFKDSKRWRYTHIMPMTWTTGPLSPLTLVASAVAESGSDDMYTRTKRGAAKVHVAI